MTSSYETCRGNATQDKRKGRRAAMTAFERSGKSKSHRPAFTSWATRVGCCGRRCSWAGKTASAAEVVKTPLPGIRLGAVKFEISGYYAAKTPQPFQPFLPV